MAKVLKNLLSDYGYNLVALPKAGIEPLTLLYKKDDGLGSLGSPINKLFAIGNKAEPEILRDTEVPDIEGSAALTLDATGGVSILENLLAKLNMGKLGANLKLDSNNTVTISYQNVLEDKVELLDLDNFISESNPATAQFNTYKEKLENSDLYVISAILKSNSFSITVEDKNGQHVDIEATVKGILGAKVDLTRNKNNSITLKHSNEKPVVFAFQAQRIIYDKKKWWQFGKKDEALFRIQDQQGEILKNESDLPTQPLKLGNEMAEL